MFIHWIFLRLHYNSQGPKVVLSWNEDFISRVLPHSIGQQCPCEAACLSDLWPVQWKWLVILSLLQPALKTGSLLLRLAKLFLHTVLVLLLTTIINYLAKVVPSSATTAAFSFCTPSFTAFLLPFVVSSCLLFFYIFPVLKLFYLLFSLLAFCFLSIFSLRLKTTSIHVHPFPAVSLLIRSLMISKCDLF